MALSLGLIFGAHEVAGVGSGTESVTDVDVEAAGAAAPVLTVEPASRAVADRPDQRTC
jgi:hypothetical protein